MKRLILAITSVIMTSSLSRLPFGPFGFQGDARMSSIGIAFRYSIGSFRGTLLRRSNSVFLRHPFYMRVNGSFAEELSEKDKLNLSACSVYIDVTVPSVLRRFGSPLFLVVNLLKGLNSLALQ